MNIDAKHIDTVNSLISAKISQKTFEEKKSHSAKNIAKHASVKGFRKGKAPVKLVSGMYANEIESQARKDLIDEVINKGLKQLEIDESTLFTAPYLSAFNEVDGGFEFEATICQKPIIKLDGLEKIIPTMDEPSVSDDEVNERVSALLKSSSPLEVVEEKRALIKGDFAMIDFEGFIGGVAFNGGKASDYLLEIGSESFIPGFEDGCLGMQIEEQREVTVSFPQNYQAADLAGKDAMFKVTLRQIQTRPECELTDESAKRIFAGDPEASSEKVKSSVKEQIAKEKRVKIYAEEVKPALLEKLVDAYIFDLPQSVIEQEIDAIANNKLSALSEAELEAYKEVQKVKDLREELKEEATKNVRITFIIDELAKTNGVIVNDQEVAQAIMMEAYQSGQDPMKLLEMYKSYNLLPAVKMSIIEDRVLLKLIDGATKATK